MIGATCREWNTCEQLSSVLVTGSGTGSVNLHRTLRAIRQPYAYQYINMYLHMLRPLPCWRKSSKKQLRRRNNLLVRVHRYKYHKSRHYGCMSVVTHTGLYCGLVHSPVTDLYLSVSIDLYLYILSQLSSIHSVQVHIMTPV